MSSSLFGDLCRQPSSKQDFAALVSQLYTSGKYSDLVIKCEDRKFNVHRAIVCTQSRPIAAAIDHGFKEASTGEIHLEEDDPEIVELMINFLYNGNYVLPRTLTAKPGNETAAQSSVRQGTPASGPTTPKSPIFGTAGQQGTATGAHPPTNLFGAPPATTAAASTATAGGLFSTGGSTAAPFGAATGGLFGNGATANPSGSGLFAFPTSSAASAALSSTANATATSPPSFAYPPPASPTNPNAATSTRFLFSNDNSIKPSRPFTKPNKKISNMYTHHPELCGEHLVKNAKVYIIADKYDIQPLKKLACDKYTDMLSTSWDSSEFVQTIELIFDGTPAKIFVKDSIRQAAIEAAAKHSKELLDRGEFVTLCQERGDIATAILQAASKKSWK